VVQDTWRPDSMPNTVGNSTQFRGYVRNRRRHRRCRRPLLGPRTFDANGRLDDCGIGELDRSSGRGCTSNRDTPSRQPRCRRIRITLRSIGTGQHHVAHPNRTGSRWRRQSLCGAAAVGTSDYGRGFSTPASSRRRPPGYVSLSFWDPGSTPVHIGSNGPMAALSSTSIKITYTDQGRGSRLAGRHSPITAAPDPCAPARGLVSSAPRGRV
jgi:hypothetical protein